MQVRFFENYRTSASAVIVSTTIGRCQVQNVAIRETIIQTERNDQVFGA